MHVIDEGSSPRRHRDGVITAATLIIVFGLLFLGRNLGLISHSLFRIIISWQMLLIFLGVVSIFRRKFVSGVILVFIGSFFITPKYIGATGAEWAETWWPLLLVAVGVVMIFGFLLKPDKFFRRDCRGHNFSSEVSYKSDKGFVESDVSFGSVNQIVVDPVFLGARIRNSFGATVLDLRRTTLQEQETFIDLDCNFGGIEIYVPESWTIHTQIKNFLGGTEDKRFRVSEGSADGKRLIIRGNVSFGGVEIKS